jgi:hypothetical protein
VHNVVDNTVAFKEWLDLVYNSTELAHSVGLYKKREKFSNIDPHMHKTFIRNQIAKGLANVLADFAQLFLLLSLALRRLVGGS